MFSKKVTLKENYTTPLHKTCELDFFIMLQQYHFKHCTPISLKLNELLLRMGSICQARNLYSEKLQ